MLSLFGAQNFEEISAIQKDREEGFNEEGRFHFFYEMIDNFNIKINRNKLAEYDSNIKEYLNQINSQRTVPINLKYFQYLAILFTEIFLDSYFQNLPKFLTELNKFTQLFTGNRDYFNLKDLTKLAFWMATGSGKTIILHINYLQFIKYNKGPKKIKFDNILLITPNQHLSYQHHQELSKSGILSGYFQDAIKQDIYNFSLNQIKIIEIHKFTEQKSGKGVSIDVEALGQKNIIFVDEGHKGSGGISWKKYRDYLALNGFTFEYSATFGQAIASAGKNWDQLIQEYGKSILFDYSYRYFYTDGYGKEYLVINLKDKIYSRDLQDTLMLANLLTFYEQKIVFERYKSDFKEYNLENPLWIFVGSRVSGKAERSDVFQIIQFINNFLKNEQWAISQIKKIIVGNSGLFDSNERDIYALDYPGGKLVYLRDNKFEAHFLYQDILNRIFHIKTPAPIRLVKLSNAPGEIALKVGISPFFGIINIGDVTDFLKYIRKQDDKIPIENDNLSGSLFSAVNNSQSKINFLIGAKKFIEGWNSWRVSVMGLLNIGKSEGAQIVQLFGRGVRLKGKDRVLKRSIIIDSNPPRYLNILETLTIFSIKANYMEQFRIFLETEGISIADKERFPALGYENNLNRREITRISDLEKTKFKNKHFFRLELDDSLKVQVDFRPNVEIITASNQIEPLDDPSEPSYKIEQKYLDLLDWNMIYFAILEYKDNNKWNNIIISKNILQRILEVGLYSLKCPIEMITPRKFSQIDGLTEIVISILKKYVKTFYNRVLLRWTEISRI